MDNISVVKAENGKIFIKYLLKGFIYLHNLTAHLGVTGHVGVEVLGLGEGGPLCLAPRPPAHPPLAQVRHDVPLAGIQAAGGQAVTWTNQRQVSADIDQWDC